MNKYIDKGTVFVLSILTYIQLQTGFYLVVPVIVAVLVSALLSYFENDWLSFGTFAGFCAAALLYPPLICFLPLIVYDLSLSKHQVGMLIALIPVVNAFSSLPTMLVISMILFFGVSFLMKLRTVSLDKVRSQYVALRDETKEFSLQLEYKNKELMDKQDYEVHLATLNERNRIARDIHDSIGHILSNAILQTGAILATCKDEAQRERFMTLKDTLVDGMNSVRESVHDLYEESVDLYAEVKNLADRFDFCELSLEYDVDSNPDKKIKYALIGVIKEALSNIIRHSDATAARLTLREHPAMYQLVIADNGTRKEADGEGIGLKNMEQRILSLNGIFRSGWG